MNSRIALFLVSMIGITVSLPAPDTCTEGLAGADCSDTFLQCVHGEWVVRNCGEGTKFNSVTGQCDWPYNVCGETEKTTTTTTEKSTTDPSGSCTHDTSWPKTPCDSRYIVCVHGTPYDMNCPANLKYNGKLCDYDYNVAACDSTSQTPTPTKPETELVCEHDTLVLECEGSETIKIESASYGRNDDGQTCPHPQMKDFECHADTSMQVVSEACEGKSRCEVEAENAEFTDPCVGTFKYLEVEYQCV